MKPKTAVQKYESSLKGRGLVRISLIIPSNGDARKSVITSARRLRKKHGVALPND